MGGALQAVPQSGERGGAGPGRGGRGHGGAGLRRGGLVSPATCSARRVRSCAAGRTRDSAPGKAGRRDWAMAPRGVQSSAILAAAVFVGGVVSSPLAASGE